MNLKLKLTLLLSILATASHATAETVLLYENFNDDYTKSFAYLYDGDGNEPHRSIASIFYSNATEQYMPWWLARDNSQTKDRFMASHSYYTSPEKSYDWLISVPLEISTEGFVLEFDAQCVNVRGTPYISDLSLYITDQMISLDFMPEEPTYVWEKVPYGKDIDNCENDWTHYSFSLDEYAGKTIYINFVNENDDKDILCIDNVKVYRDDPVEISLKPYDTITANQYATLSMDLKVTANAGLDKWSVDLYRDGQAVMNKESNEHWDNGSQTTIDFEIGLNEAENTDFELIFSTPGKPSLSVGGSILNLAFETKHRVFFEETTSLHCGNCPMGMYTIESMLEDKEMADKIVPVSVHLMDLGYDPMATKDYYSNLPLYNSAPLVFVERNTEYTGFIPAFDSKYDPTNEKSFAYNIAKIADQLALMDVEVAADWVISGADTTAVKCSATVKPACNINGKEYRVAFILTENNVGLDNNPYWIQDNYLSGAEVESHWGGWTNLMSSVINARYHDVARAISQYNGHKDSLPLTMKAGQEYTFEYTLDIPDTALKDNNLVISAPIQRQFCELSAIVIDAETNLVVNACRVAMSDVANDRFSISSLTGINDITADQWLDDEQHAVYYDMTGRRVEHPHGGVFIRVTPASATKVLK